MKLKASSKTDHPLFPWIIFTNIVIGIFMVNLDSSILSVAMPVFKKNYNAEPMTLQWLMVGYLLIITAILPAVGALSDRFGRKHFFTFGLGLFTLGSLLCAMAADLTQLNIARIIQGLGGAGITANGMSIVANAFPKGSRGKPLGLIGSVVSIATLSGPVVGGILLNAWGWRSIFFINIPFGLAGIILYFLYMKAMPEHNEGSKKFDILGSVLFFIGMGSLILYLSLGSTLHWTNIITIILLSLAVIFIISFIVWQAKCTYPLIELSFFKIPDYAIGNITKYISFVVMMFFMFISPFFLDALGFSVIMIGILLAVQSVTNIVFAPICGWLSDRFSKNLIALIGLILCSLGFYLVSVIGENTSLAFIVVAISFIGIGMAFYQSPTNVSILESVPMNRSGMAGSFIAIVRNFGRVSGVSIATIIFYRGAGELTNDAHIIGNASFTFIVAFLLTMLGAILTLWLLVKEKKLQSLESPS